MDVNEKILQRLDELVAETQSRAVVSDSDYDWFQGWVVAALPTIEQLAGKNSNYYKQFSRWVYETFSPSTAFSILRRVRDDFAKGYLRDFRELIAAEVFTDFLDMAEHLHTGGYHHAAASISGAVLEDCLRRLHLKHIGPWQGDSSLNKLNEGLRKAEVYGQAAWRQIQAWGDIRNEADHGHFDKVDAGQVKLMVQGIRDFIAKHEG